MAVNSAVLDARLFWFMVIGENLCCLVMDQRQEGAALFAASSMLWTIDRPSSYRAAANVYAKSTNAQS